jgi:hypothetical protein
MGVLSKTLFTTAMLASLTFAGAARAEDPHALFEDRCGRCHGHAGPFVAEAVVLQDSQAVTKADAEPLADFLRGHRGRLTTGEVTALTAHMTRIAERSGLFRGKCRDCHESARDLAHDKLVLRDGRVVGRYSDRDMADFLPGHGRATSEDVQSLLAMLREQLTALNR